MFIHKVFPAKGSVHKMGSINFLNMSVQVNTTGLILFNQLLRISGFSVKKVTAIPTSEKTSTAMQCRQLY